MLDKIRSFNSLVDVLVLNEGYFYVPEKIFADIKKDAIRILKSLSKNPDLNVPIKKYELDFSGTNYEFLNDLEPRPSVDVKFTKGGGRIKGSFHIADKFRLEKNSSLIQIDLTDKIITIYDDIEHEVSHFVQEMIKKHSGNLGGMPSKKYISDLEDSKEHSKIPKEMYPDLLSAIRELQFIFSKMSTYREPNEDDKKVFFKLFLNSLKDKKPIGNKAPRIFKDFSELPEPLYKKLLKIAYNAFVNKPLNFDPKELLEIEKKIS